MLKRWRDRRRARARTRKIDALLVERAYYQGQLGWWEWILIQSDAAQGDANSIAELSGKVAVCNHKLKMLGYEKGAAP